MYVYVCVCMYVRIYIYIYIYIYIHTHICVGAEGLACLYREFTKGGLVKGGCSNKHIIITYKLRNEDAKAT